MFSGRAVDAAGAVGGGTAPDALDAGFGRIWSNTLRNCANGKSRRRERTNSTLAKIHETHFTINTLPRKRTRHNSVGAEIPRPSSVRLIASYASITYYRKGGGILREKGRDLPSNLLSFSPQLCCNAYLKSQMLDMARIIAMRAFLFHAAKVLFAEFADLGCRIFAAAHEGIDMSFAELPVRVGGFAVFLDVEI